MKLFRSILFTGAFLLSAASQAASAGTIKYASGEIPYETVRFFSPYCAIFKDEAKSVDCNTLKKDKSERAAQAKAEVKFPEKPEAEDFKAAENETEENYYITPLMAKACNFRN